MAKKIGKVTEVKSFPCILYAVRLRRESQSAVLVGSMPGVLSLLGLSLHIVKVLTACLLLSVSTLAQADPEQARSLHYQLNIPSQNVEAALNELAVQTEHMLLFPYEPVHPVSSNAVKGRHSIQQALAIMLKGTELAGDLTQGGVITISADGMNENEGINKMNSRKKLLASTVAFFVGGGMESGLAQEGVQDKKGKFVLEEVVVTAEKRTASLQEVPVAVTAFSGSQLIDAGVDDARDLEMVTPGLVFTSNTGLGIVSIRGIGSPFSQGPGFDPSSAVYVDGVYQSRFTSAVIGLMDLERVEVLKGPQGTLYGRNSVGGAINYISKGPGDELGGEVRVQVGNYNLREIQGTLDVPLIDDELLFRGTVMGVKRDGFTENLLNTSDDIEAEDSVAGRFTLKYFYSEDVDITIHAGFSDRNGAVNPGKKHLFIDPDGPNAGAEIISDPRKILADQTHESSSESSYMDITTRLDLGSMMFTSVTGYNDQTMGPMREDFDATELGIIHIATPGQDDGLYFDTHSFSQEFLLSSNEGEQSEWLVGLYYFHENAYGQSGTHLPGFAIPFKQNRALNVTDAYAGFGNYAYQMTDQLRVNFGLRYSYEKKDFTHSVYRDYTLSEGPVNREESWSSWTPKFSADYFITDDVMVYLSASRGFKSGGFNAFGSIDNPVLDPEILDAYEIGAKTTIFDGRMTFNVSAFDYDFTDMQVLAVDESSGGISSVYRNAGEAKIQGMEVEVSALALEGLQVDVGLSWLDAEFTDFEAVGGNLKGNTVPNSPEFTANLGIKYSQELGDWGSVDSQADYYYSDEIFYNEFNDPSWTADSYYLLNLRVTLKPYDSTWKFAVFAKNVTDELVLELPYNFPGVLGADARLAHLAPPRTYGAEISYQF